MPAVDSMQDVVVIGGGFYGAAIAIYMAKQRGFKRIVLVEREAALLTRASYNNQARVHNGYHYPRSFVTAYRSRINLPKFVRDWPQAVYKDFSKLYAIARRNSKVTSRQFQRFCQEIGARLEPVEQSMRQLFEPRLIEDVFMVEEYAFNSTQLADWAREELSALGVQVLLGTTVTTVKRSSAGGLDVTLTPNGGDSTTLHSGLVFNCTYSGLNQIGGDFAGTKTGLKHEITEMALMQMPPLLQDIGVTVMDGPFFSLMPFPARQLHTVSHVRYTPHMSWTDRPGLNPYDELARYDRATRVDRMIRDISRYMPGVGDATHEDSLFEVKTILTKNEGDDGRPILFEKHDQLKGFYSVLGGKIDNIYDVLEKLDDEEL